MGCLIIIIILFWLQKMSSLVERLRVRSERRPVYNLDESDDDDYVSGKAKNPQEKIERFVRDDAVCFFSSHFFLVG